MARFNPDIDQGEWAPISWGDSLAVWAILAVGALPWVLLIRWIVR